jgi:DNA-binding XRE family transcriptional regulator
MRSDSVHLSLISPLATLVERSGPTCCHMQRGTRLVNYLRAHRKKAGLSQRELGVILGYTGKDAIYRHESFDSVPPLLMGFAYEILFQEPVSELFPGIRETVEGALEQSLAKFANSLQEKLKTAKGSNRAQLEHKLAWINKKINADI